MNKEFDGFVSEMLLYRKTDTLVIKNNQFRTILIKFSLTLIQCSLTSHSLKLIEIVATFQPNPASQFAVFIAKYAKSAKPTFFKNSSTTSTVTGHQND